MQPSTTTALQALVIVVRSLRTRGVRGSWGRTVRMLQARGTARRWKEADRIFDAERSVETGGWVRPAELATDSENLRHSVRYQPTNVEEFAELMGKLDVDHREFVFVDYGSGKGRVLILAADYPFKQIVGVEFSPPLVRTARKNVAKLAEAGDRIEIVEQDAIDFEPPLAPLVVYFFNPFGLAVLSPVLERLRASLDEHPRPAFVIATGPPELALAIEEAGFASVDVDRRAWRTRGVFARLPVSLGATVGSWVTAIGIQIAA